MAIRKIAAVMMIVAVMLSLTSCGYNPKTVGTITDPDGNVIDITCGEYLAAQYEAVVNLLNQAGAPDNVDLAAILDTPYGDGTIRDYLYELIPSTILNRAATDYIYGKVVGETDLPTKIYFDQYVQNDWAADSTVMLQNGIGFESFEAYETQILRASQIPYVLYGEGGEQELSDEYLADYVENSVGRFTYLSLPYRKFSGDPLSQTEIETLRNYANEILAKVLDGSMAPGLSPKEKISGAASDYVDEYQNMMGYQQEMSSVTYENTRFLRGDGKFSTSAYEQMFNVPVGGYAVIDGGSGLFTVVYRHELAEEDTAENMIDDIITATCGEMFTEYVLEVANGFRIEFDDKARQYYSLDKVVV